MFTCPGRAWGPMGNLWRGSLLSSVPWGECDVNFISVDHINTAHLSPVPVHLVYRCLHVDSCDLGYIVQTKVQIPIWPYDIIMEIEISERFCIETICLKYILAVQKLD